MEAATAAPAETLLSAAEQVAADPALAMHLTLLERRAALKCPPADMTGRKAFAWAEEMRARPHELVVAIARLTGRELAEVAAEAEACIQPAPEPEPEPGRGPEFARAEKRRRARELRAVLERAEPQRSTGEQRLDKLVRASGGLVTRALARLLDPKVGARDPASLQPYERAHLAADFFELGEKAVDDALALLAAIRASAHLRSAWDRWKTELAPPPGRSASAPAGPPGRRARPRGQHALVETRTRMAGAQEMPVPWAVRRWPVARAPVERNADTGFYEWEDLNGAVRCTFNPCQRALRYVLGLGFLLRESDHLPNPGGGGRRTIEASYNLLSFAAYGRSAHGEEYRFMEGFLAEMAGGYFEAEDRRPEEKRRKGDYATAGTPLEAVYIRLAGGAVMTLRDWLALPECERGRRGRGGSGATLLLTFTEHWYSAVMSRKGHFLCNKRAVWGLRGGLALYKHLECNTGVKPGEDSWQGYLARPMLRQAGLHGKDKRACERQLYRDALEVCEASPRHDWARPGDSKNHNAEGPDAWLVVGVNRRGDCAPKLVDRRRVPTRRELRELHPDKWAPWGHRRTFAAGATGHGRRRAEAMARKVAGLPVLPESKRRRLTRSRKRLQADLVTAAAGIRGP